MSITRSQELRRGKVGLVEKMRAIADKAQSEKRLMTAEERQQIDGIEAEVKAHSEEIERLERLEGYEGEVRGARPLEAGRPTTQTAEGGGEEPEKQESTAYRGAFKAYLHGGYGSLSTEQRAVVNSRRATIQTAELPPEVRAALGVGTDTVGGFLVPTEPTQAFLEAQKFFGGMKRTRAEKITTSHGRELPFVTGDGTANEGRLLGENRPATGATEPQFGRRSLFAYIYTSDYVQVPFDLVQDTDFDLEGYILRIFGERIGRITDRHYTSGDGSSKPEGVTVGAKLGKAGATGQTATVKDTDLTELMHSVDPAYRDNFEWMFHDTTLLAIKLLKDGEGRRLWQSGIAVREPDTVEGKTYIVNNYMPTMAPSARSILGGDFYYYKIRQVSQVISMRLAEKFAEYGQVAYLLFSRHDGKLIYPANTANSTTLCPIKYFQNSAS